MTGAYQTWQYGPAGWLVDLNEFIKDPAATAPDWNVGDILPGLLHSDAWSGVPGEPLGGPNAKQWALPWGFELNSIAYNKRMFAQAKVDPPKNLPDLIEKAVKLQTDIPGIYGIGVRGSRSWATIHPGYLSGLTSYGGSDFTVENGKLKSGVNSPQCKAFTKLWIEMIQKAGPKNWTNFTWYEVGNGLGAGASAMIFDADILGFFQQKGTKEAGNIGYEGFAANPDKKEPTPNVWIWSLAINTASNNKGAAWLLLQWAAASQQCLFGATKADLVDPVRQSVWDDKGFQDRLKETVRRLPRAVHGLGARLEDLLHAAAVVLQPDDGVGRQPAEDVRQRSVGRRGARQARRERHGPAARTPASSSDQTQRGRRARFLQHRARRPRILRGLEGMSTSGVASMNARPVVRRRRARMAGMLPYLLSMPALLTCIGILVPFGTAIYYSLQRYNLAFPTTRGFIWFANYISLFRDATFWGTIVVSMAYTVLTVGLELLLGLGIALLLWRRTLVTNLLSVTLMLPLMVAPAIAA